MKIILVINDVNIELLDQNVEFTEGEQVVVKDKGTLRVESIHKEVTVAGSSADLAYRVILR